MKRKNRLLKLLALALCVCAIAAHYLLDPWGFYYKVSPEEAALRLSLVEAAQAHLGKNEADGSFQSIVDRYNAQDPLPVGYVLQYSDSWCAAFATVSAMDAGLTGIIPPECSCQRQIDAFEALGRWEERDDIVPAPGDLIYYDWNWKRPGDCRGWADHVGIVVGVKWPFVKVIEGNRKDDVSYRYILLNDLHIRGFGQPDYASVLQE